jgi:hypothetical protein
LEIKAYQKNYEDTIDVLIKKSRFPKKENGQWKNRRIWQFPTAALSASGSKGSGKAVSAKSSPTDKSYIALFRAKSQTGKRENEKTGKWETGKRENGKTGKRENGKTGKRENWLGAFGGGATPSYLTRDFSQDFEAYA